MMSPVGMLFIHDPMTIAMGNAADMEKAIATLNEVKESIINAYVGKTGLSRSKVAKLMSDETWMNAKKAVELGFADAILFADGKGENADDEREVEAAWQPYSTKVMGQAILNRLVSSAENHSGADEECENAEKKKGHTCTAENVTEASLKQAVVIAWNQIVVEREKRKAEWERLAAEGDALERYRSRLMLAVTADGPLDEEIPELTRMFLEEIQVYTPTDLTVRFLDGTEKRVRTD